MQMQPKNIFKMLKKKLSGKNSVSTLLIVSFVVQKLLGLIRSHLFIFAFISITLGGEV